MTCYEIDPLRKQIVYNSLIPFTKSQDINNFSPSLVFTAWNLGDKIVPTTKAVNGTNKPVRLVYLKIKKRKEINKIAKLPNWYKKALNCNLVIVMNDFILYRQLEI